MIIMIMVILKLNRRGNGPFFILVLYTLSRVPSYSNIGGRETRITVECDVVGQEDMYYNRI